MSKRYGEMIREQECAENATLRAEVEQWKRNEQIARNAIIEIGEKYKKLEAENAALRVEVKRLEDGYVGLA